MANEIKNVQLKFNCTADWNNMTNANGGRHCHSCSKTVYDFTNAKANEFHRILAEQNNNVCGRFRAGQMAAEPIRIPVWKKWISAALILIGINAINKTFAQGVPLPPKHVSKAKQTAVSNTQTVKINEKEPIFNGFVAGEPMTMAHFPGGEEAFSKFLSSHIKYQKGAIEEKVVATFVVKKNGSISTINIIRGKDKANIAEVVRVLKLSPKWVPAKSSTGKTIESQYTVPVSFSR